MPQNILITGASSEIGLAVAAEFNRAGNRLVLQCSKNLERLRGAVKDFVAEVELVEVDFTNYPATDEFISSLKDIDVIVNVAAVTKTDIIVNINDADIQKMVDVNILAPIKICRALILKMIIKRKGSIVNITSIAASRGNAGQSVYAGTKGFMESFTRALAAEFGQKGIRVNAVAPGAIDAGSIRELLNIAPDEVKKSISLNRFGTAKEVASCVAFLCSNEALFINGQVIHIDGGFTRGV